MITARPSATPTHKSRPIDRDPGQHKFGITHMFHETKQGRPATRPAICRLCREGCGVAPQTPNPCAAPRARPGLGSLAVARGTMMTTRHVKPDVMGPQWEADDVIVETGNSMCLLALHRAKAPDSPPSIVRYWPNITEGPAVHREFHPRLPDEEDACDA